jgi:toxin ParE1/3/4
MSGRKFRFILSENASNDLQKIQDFSLESWGQEQATTYDDAILRALATIQEHPNLGVARGELGPGFRILRVKSPTISYRIAGDAIIIQRILHQRMDVTRERLT